MQGPRIGTELLQGANPSCAACLFGLDEDKKEDGGELPYEQELVPALECCVLPSRPSYLGFTLLERATCGVGALLPRMFAKILYPSTRWRQDFV